MTGVLAWLRPAGAARPPAGYRAGATLAQLQRELPGLRTQWLDGPGLRIADGTLELTVHECVQRHLLMHIVQCEFRMTLAARLPSGWAGARVELGHQGWLRRTGVRIQATGSTAAARKLAAHLDADAALLSAVLPLDCVRLEVGADEQGWQVRLTHYGASEVVSRFPATRRYVRLSAPQREALLRVFARLHRRLAAIEQMESAGHAGSAESTERAAFAA